MEPITDSQLALTCPTTTIMGGSNNGASGSGSNARDHHHHHSHRHHDQKMTLTPIQKDTTLSPNSAETQAGSLVTSKEDEEDSSNAASSDCKSPGQRYVNHFVFVSW